MIQFLHLLLQNLHLSTQINLSWLPPIQQYGQKLVGYKIEIKNAPGDYQIIDENTGNGTTKYSIDGLTPETTYTYRVLQSILVHKATHQMKHLQQHLNLLHHL